jgi:hypothetical protein
MIAHALFSSPWTFQRYTEPPAHPRIDWKASLKLAEQQDQSLARLGMAILALSETPLTNASVRKRLFSALRRTEYSPLFLERARVGSARKEAWIKFLLEILQAPQHYSEEVLSIAQGRLTRLVGPADPAIENEQELGLPITGLT